jgi:hypothetical protein
MAQQALFEKTDDLAADSPRSLEAPKPSNFQFEHPDWMLFRSVDTLPTKAGVRATLLRRLGLKELTDNALDTGATVTVGQIDDNSYVIQDDGPGIDGTPEQIARLFSINRDLVSSKLWRLPTRGAMGNGLRVVAGAVAASNGRLVVWTRNRRLILTPQEDGGTAVEASEIDFPNGTWIGITFGSALPADEDNDALTWARAAIEMAGGEPYSGKPSPHWYDGDQFFRMLKASGKRPVREIVAELEGCSGQKAGRITAAVKGMACNALTQEQAIEVLKRARAETRPVPAGRLGKVGEKHPTLPQWYAIEEGSFMTNGREPKASIPFRVEAWVRVDPKGKNDADVHLLVNCTPITGQYKTWKEKNDIRLFGCGLSRRFELPKGFYDITINIITPYCPITTEGKEPDLSRFLRQIIQTVTKAAKRARAAIPPNRTITLKDAAWKVMEEAYLEASTDGTLPANARQIMYRARGPILAMTGKPSLDDKYFTQTLLPDFMTEKPNLTADWDVVFDNRGKMVEPHTEVQVPLGTIGVRDYLGRKASKTVKLHTGGTLFPTSGARNRFGGVLFIEKEGFDPLLEAARIAEMFDLAIASTKGMSVTAIRRLLDELQVPVYSLHDMDINGRTIYGTLTTDGRRYEFKNNIQIHDLGLRYEDVIAMGLESEPFDLGKNDPAKVRETLIRHGACDGEIDMLLNQRRRVELNAMTSDQFVAFLKRRLIECGAQKVIPDSMTLEEAYRRSLVQRQLKDEAERLRAQAEQDAKAADVPADLEEQVQQLMNDDPCLSWDRALIVVMDATKRRR